MPELLCGSNVLLLNKRAIGKQYQRGRAIVRSTWNIAECYIVI